MCALDEKNIVDFVFFIVSASIPYVRNDCKKFEKDLGYHVAHRIARQISEKKSMCVVYICETRKMKQKKQQHG